MAAERENMDEKDTHSYSITSTLSFLLLESMLFLPLPLFFPNQRNQSYMVEVILIIKSNLLVIHEFTQFSP